MHVLVYGSSGFLGSRICELLEQKEHKVTRGIARIDNPRQLKSELVDVNPTHVFSATGRTHMDGFNTIDGLEGDRSKLTINIQDNLTGPLVLASLCVELRVHLTILSTGCIYHSQYKGEKALDSFTELDHPNFFGSSYSIVKGSLNSVLAQDVFASKVLTLRIRLPIFTHPHARNSLTKILTYPKICSLDNSITDWDLFERYLQTLMMCKITGLLNFVNRGAVSHRFIIDKYRLMVDPNHKCKFVSPSELAATLKAERSNCVLDTSRLENIFDGVPTATDAIVNTLQSYGLNLH